MAQPQQFAAALRVALWLVWAAYVVVSHTAYVTGYVTAYVTGYVTACSLLTSALLLVAARSSAVLCQLLRALR
jgi:hypothetical protein